MKKVTATVNQYGQNVSVEIIDPMKANDRLAEIHGLLKTEGNNAAPEEQAKSIRSHLEAMEEADNLAPPVGPHSVN